jgi:hypothetical protein
MNLDAAAVSLEGFVTEHGNCWRVSGLDMQNYEDDAMVRVLCPGRGASVTVQKKR